MSRWNVAGFWRTSAEPLLIGAVALSLSILAYFVTYEIDLAKRREIFLVSAEVPITHVRVTVEDHIEAIHSVAALLEIDSPDPERFIVLAHLEQQRFPSIVSTHLLSRRPPRELMPRRCGRPDGHGRIHPYRSSFPRRMWIIRA